MRDARQVLWGIITGLISIALVIGVLSLSLVEGNQHLPAATPSSTIYSTQTVLQRPPTTQPLVITLTGQPSSSLVSSATPLTPTVTSTFSPTPSYTSTYLLPAVAIRTPIPCGAPRGWIIYVVQPGDTLYHLGQVYGIPYTEIQNANCLSTTSLRVGQRLYVPPWATRTPSPTFPVYPFLTDTPSDITVETWTPTNVETATDTPLPPTETPTIGP